MATADQRITSLEEKMKALEKPRRESNLVAWGLTIPLGPWSLTFWLVLLAAIILFIWKAPADRVSIIVGLFHLNEKGKVVQDDEISSVYTLVTPHEGTLEDLKGVNPPLTEEETKYYTFDKDAFEGFAKQIKEEGAQGYTRREVWGSGFRPPKRGWEWTINWRKDRAIKLGRLLEIYAKYFHRSENIYIEERQVGKTLFGKK